MSARQKRSSDRGWYWAALLLGTVALAIGCNPGTLSYFLMPWVDDKVPPRVNVQTTAPPPSTADTTPAPAPTDSTPNQGQPTTTTVTTPRRTAPRTAPTLHLTNRLLVRVWKWNRARPVVSHSG